LTGLLIIDIVVLTILLFKIL